MSKTNHRINKDREERRGEAPAHKVRRDMGLRLNDYIERYNHGDTLDDEEFLEEAFSEDEYYKTQRIQR